MHNIIVGEQKVKIKRKREFTAWPSTAR